MSGELAGAEPRLVTPGQVVGPVTGKRTGTGTFTKGEEIIATRLGWVRENSGVVSVDPVNTFYLPRSGDLVVGIVESVRNNLWFAEINGAFNGLLPMSLAPWKVEFGAARQHMDVGDCILARVQEVDETHNVVLTMKGVGLRKLNDGVVVELAPHHVERFSNSSNDLLKKLRDASDCRIIPGQNGRVWVDGDSDGIAFVRGVFDIYRESGHLSNIDELVDAAIESNVSGGEA